MRRWVLVLSVMAMALLLSSCAGRRPPLGLGVDFMDEQGRPLDHPYGDEKVEVHVPFIQNYPGPVWVSVDGGPRVELKPGKNRVYSKTSEKIIPFEVWWDEKVGYDSVLQGERHYRVGLYTGEPIIIDERFLRNCPEIEIVFSNTDAVYGNFNDSQGNTFRLAGNQSIELKLAPGEYRIDWRPDNYNGPTMHGCKVLRPGKKVFFNGKFYDDRIFVDRVKPSPQDIRRMQWGGCFSLE